MVQTETRCRTYMRAHQAVASYCKVLSVLRVTKSKDSVVGALVISLKPDVVWQIDEHEIHGRCKHLAVLRLLLFDEHT